MIHGNQQCGESCLNKIFEKTYVCTCINNPQNVLIIHVLIIHNVPIMLIHCSINLNHRPLDFVHSHRLWHLCIPHTCLSQVQFAALHPILLLHLTDCNIFGWPLKDIWTIKNRNMAELSKKDRTIAQYCNRVFYPWFICLPEI